jgi:cytosine/adenosine deaminase-related metal-dependent hydrolase
LPSRGEFLISNAYIMTMDAAGDIANGAIHVKDGAIVAVGKEVAAPGMPVIDAEGMIVMPGLVDTHWHCWNTLFRSFSGDQHAHGYFPTVARFGAQMTPEHMYQSARLSAAEAINSGTTFVHDWCHNVRSRDHAEQDMRGLNEVGIRGRFSCGWPQGLSDTQISDLSVIQGLHRDWKNYENGGLLDLGLAWRGQFRVSPIPEEIYRAEFDTARKLGVPITVHCGSARKAVGQIANLAKAKLLGKDVQIVHGLAANADEMKAMRDVGTVISLAPASELRIGFGFPSTSELLAEGVQVGVSLDTAALTGHANLFNVLKLLRDVENARAESEFKMSARKALEIGTIAGATSLGVGDQIGSLKAGKRADIIMISPNSLNMAVVTDPAHLVLESTGPENIDTVIVDGRILKRSGKLTSVSVPEVVSGARRALAEIRQKANWR